MRQFFDIERYHWLIVFVLAGLFAAGFAFSTYNLFHLTMANLSFLQSYGLVAIQNGALTQTFEIAVGGGFSLVCYLGFKLCECELIARFREWTGSSK